MPRHPLLFCGLLLFGLVAPPSRAAGNDGKACSRALHQTFTTSASATTLPVACAHIGPLALGMRKQQVLAALGQPDVTHTDAVDPNRLSLLYLYPRDIKAQLAQHPRRAGTLVQGELAVGLRNDRVSNLIAFADQRRPRPSIYSAIRSAPRSTASSKPSAAARNGMPAAITSSSPPCHWPLTWTRTLWPSSG